MYDVILSGAACQCKTCRWHVLNAVKMRYAHLASVTRLARTESEDETRRIFLKLSIQPHFMRCVVHNARRSGRPQKNYCILGMRAVFLTRTEISSARISFIISGMINGNTHHESAAPMPMGPVFAA